MQVAPQIDVVRADEPDQRGRRGQHQEQIDPDQGLDQREGPSTQFVAHPCLQQRVTGDPGDPGERAHEDDEDACEHEVGYDGDQQHGHAGGGDAQAEQAGAAVVAEQPRPERHAGGEPDEHRTEQDAVGGVTTAEKLDVEPSERHHAPRAGETAENPDDQTADQPVVADEPQTFRDRRPEARVHLGAVVVGPADATQSEDHRRRHQERRRVEVEREVERGGLEERHAGGERPRQGGQQREDRRTQRRRTVCGDQAQGVRRRESLHRHQVRHTGVLGRVPEQADALDQQGCDEQPHQRPDQWNGDEQAEP